MNKCPFCGSEAVVSFGNGETVYKYYEKNEEHGTAMSRSYSHQTWDLPFTSHKFLCTQCGIIHEKLNESQLKDFLDNQQYERY